VVFPFLAFPFRGGRRALRSFFSALEGNDARNAESDTSLTPSLPIELHTSHQRGLGRTFQCPLHYAFYIFLRCSSSGLSKTHCSSTIVADPRCSGSQNHTAVFISLSFWNGVLALPYFITEKIEFRE
jgi:hypothetical protein